MTPPNPLTELAERVEKNTGPDRAMDCEIAVAVGAFAKRKNKSYGNRIDYVDLREPGSEIWPGYGGDQFVPDHTASLDAAMTLTIDGYYIIAIYQMPKGWIVKISSRSNDQEPVIDVEHDSLIIALCSAWLRARAASESPHGR